MYISSIPSYLFISLYECFLFCILAWLMFNEKKLNVFTKPLPHKQGMTQGQFLSRVKLVWIQFSFYLTACPIIYP